MFLRNIDLALITLKAAYSKINGRTDFGHTLLELALYGKSKFLRNNILAKHLSSLFTFVYEPNILYLNYSYKAGSNGVQLNSVQTAARLTRCSQSSKVQNCHLA